MKNILNSKKIIMIIIILSKTLRRKMENFPEDLIEHIISFACDRRGYNSIEYHKRVEDNKPRMKRISFELINWSKCSSAYNDRLSVSWLKPTKTQKMQSKKFKESLRRGIPQICYHTGCFLSKANEERARFEIEMNDY